MHHTIVVLVEDKPGVLARVASQFRRRLFNIESMAAGQSAPGITAISIAVDSNKRDVDRLVASLSKLINVLQVEDLGERPIVERGLALVKVARSESNGAAIQSLVDAGQCRVIQTGQQTLSLELTGDPRQIDAAIKQVEALGIIDIVRSGPLALTQGDDTIMRQ
jgi:acetolactate synthase-1/3 small subunit